MRYWSWKVQTEDPTSDYPYLIWEVIPTNYITNWNNFINDHQKNLLNWVMEECIQQDEYKIYNFQEALIGFKLNTIVNQLKNL